MILDEVPRLFDRFYRSPQMKDREGVGLGSAISYAVVRAVTAQMWMFEYHFTLVPILYSIPILLLITWLIPEFCYQRMQKITVVERLREVEN